MRHAGETGFLPQTSSTTRETHLPARCRRRSRSPFFAAATRIPRLPMRFRLRREVASLAMVCFRKPVSPADRPTPGATCALKRHRVTVPPGGSAFGGGHSDEVPQAVEYGSAAGSAGDANNRSRRDSVRGQNTEAATSASAKPGASAMPVSNKRRRRVLPRRASLFAEPALPAADKGAADAVLCGRLRPPEPDESLHRCDFPKGIRLKPDTRLSEADRDPQ
jgi:hypothetical protein